MSQKGIFEYLREHYTDDSLIQRISVTSNNVYTLHTTALCGGALIFKTPPHVLIQQNPNGTFHSDFKDCIITFNLKLKASISGIGMKMMTPDHCATLQGFYLLGSNDGLHWKNITHESGPISWTHNIWNNFSFSPVKYQYYQIYQDPSRNDDRGYHYFHLSGVELYGSFVPNDNSCFPFKISLNPTFFIFTSTSFFII